MHIPDGFLSLLVAILFWVISGIVMSIALRQTKASLGERQVPLMGVMAAAIFAGQMLNFTVQGAHPGIFWEQLLHPSCLDLGRPFW